MLQLKYIWFRLNIKIIKNIMTNAEKIRTLNNDDLAYLIREIYFNGSDGNGFAFCRYNLESWISRKYSIKIWNL